MSPRRRQKRRVQIFLYVVMVVVGALIAWGIGYIQKYGWEQAKGRLKNDCKRIGMEFKVESFEKSGTIRVEAIEPYRSNMTDSIVRATLMSKGVETVLLSHLVPIAIPEEEINFIRAAYLASEKAEMQVGSHSGLDIAVSPYKTLSYTNRPDLLTEIEVGGSKKRVEPTSYVCKDSVPWGNVKMLSTSLGIDPSGNLTLRSVCNEPNVYSDAIARVDAKLSSLPTVTGEKGSYTFVGTPCEVYPKIVEAAKKTSVTVSFGDAEPASA